MAEEVDAELEELTERHQALYAENNETIERLAEKYQIGAPRSQQLSLVLEHLMEVVGGKEGTKERMEFDISFEEMFKDRLHKAEVKASGDAFRERNKPTKKLITPGGAGKLHLP